MFRSSLVVTAAVCMGACAVAQGQGPIQWKSNVQQGIAKAKRSGLPVMFYVVGSGHRGNGDLIDAQRTAFRDTLVRRIAEERFVAIRLPQSSDTRKILQQMGARPELRDCLVCATPAGGLIGVIPPGQVAEPRVLAQQMTKMFRNYRQEVFERELKPKLEDESARAGEIMKALKVIKKFLIIEADQSVTKLLEREELSKTVAKEVYDVLALLSTPRSVDALLEVAPRDKLAAKALARCTPAGAERMLEAWDREKPELFLILYEAMTKSCKIKGTKPRGFWSGKNQRLISAEIERVTTEVRKSAKRWRERYEAYR